MQRFFLGDAGPERVNVAGQSLSALSLAAFTMSVTRLAGRDQDRALRLHRFLFTAGGPVHGAGLAILLTALGLAGERTGALPRPLTVAALTSAGVDALAPAVLVAPGAAYEGGVSRARLTHSRDRAGVVP